jgi:hypothetical protein
VVERALELGHEVRAVTCRPEALTPTARLSIHVTVLGIRGQKVRVDVSAPWLRESNVLRRSFERILKQAGLPESIHFHDLRHTCATLLPLTDVNVKAVAEHLGHSKIQITLETYQRALPTMQEKASRLLIPINSLADDLISLELHDDHKRNFDLAVGWPNPRQHPIHLDVMGERKNEFIREATPGWRELEEAAQEKANAKVENALFQSALDGNVTAQQVWLYSRCPDRWRDKRAVGHSGDVEQRVIVIGGIDLKAVTGENPGLLNGERQIIKSNGLHSEGGSVRFRFHIQQSSEQPKATGVLTQIG